MAEINSAKDLREALAVLIRDYVKHLDFDAPTEVKTVRVEAVGPGLSVIYSEINEGHTSLNVGINSPPADEPTEAADEGRGWLGR
jgi:hypothetical protein